MATIVILASTVASTVWLLQIAGFAPEAQRSQAKLDAIRTGFLVGGGIGGFIALLLTLRKQRSVEIALVDTSNDSANRRNNEIFARSVEQLANESRAVRLGGVYSLERLAQENSSFRSSVVDVFCAYLRFPFQPPMAALNLHGEKKDPRQIDTDNEGQLSEVDAWEELQVRLAIQDIIRKHLTLDDRKPARFRSDLVTDSNFWEDIELNLDRAVLVSFHLERCKIARASFSNATFYETTVLRSSQFQDIISFNGAQFLRDVWFDNSTFERIANFHNTKFAHYASFSKCTFKEPALFTESTLEWKSTFEGASFDVAPLFIGCRFTKEANFTGAKFLNKETSIICRVDGKMNFEDAIFCGEVKFDVESNANLLRARIKGDQSLNIPGKWIVNATGRDEYYIIDEPKRDQDGEEVNGA